jgi:hypothetical protein
MDDLEVDSYISSFYQRAPSLVVCLLRQLKVDRVSSRSTDRVNCGQRSCAGNGRLVVSICRVYRGGCAMCLLLPNRIKANGQSHTNLSKFEDFAFLEQGAARRCLRLRYHATPRATVVQHELLSHRRGKLRVSYINLIQRLLRCQFQNSHSGVHNLTSNCHTRVTAAQSCSKQTNLSPQFIAFVPAFGRYFPVATRSG